MIIDFLKGKKNFSIDISVSDESDRLLDTGGGLKKAAWFFDDNKPFLAYNVDVLSTINIHRLYKTHCRSNALATLVVRNRETSRYFLFDKENKLCGWKNTSTNEVKYAGQQRAGLTPLAFSGIQIIDTSIFDLMDYDIFSMTYTYLNIAGMNEVRAFIDKSPIWMDMGKKQNLDEAGKLLDEINYFESK